MKKYVRSSIERDKQFVVGREYTPMKRNGEYSESRTFTVVKISRKHMKIMVKGAISGVYDIKVNNQGVEFIPLTMSNSMYLNPYATDYIISKEN